MPICAGGSEVIPGAPTLFHVDPQFIASVLPATATWIAPFLYYVDPFDVDISALCAGDPPAFPSFSASDALALIQRDKIGIFIAASEKIYQIFQRWLWYRTCRCIGTSTPAAPSFPSAPADLPAINPPAYVSLPIVQPCKTLQAAGTPYTANTGLHTLAMSITGLKATSIRWHLHTEVTVAPGPTMTAIIQQVDAANGSINTFTKTFAMPNAFDFEYISPYYPNATELWVQWNAGTAGGTTTAWARAEVFCDGDVPGAKESPCCPPDPVLQAQVNAILAMVTLIQRQLAPFATISGVEHTGLTGSGEISVQGLIGARVLLTIDTGGVGYAYGHPDAIFDAGYISWGDANGWQTSETLSANPYRSTPECASLSTKIGYTLNPGVTASILELKREP